MPAPNDNKSILESYEAKLSDLWNRDRLVRQHRRNIWRLNKRILELREKIKVEEKAIRSRGPIIAEMAADAIKQKLTRRKLSATEVYPRSVFRVLRPP
jgi:hypothetical protein